MSIARVTPPRLRTMEQEERRATWLELFYDLAFVVAVAVLADRLHADPFNVVGFFGFFALLWWLWASHTYYADRYDTDDLVYRLLAAGQMVAIVVVAASLTGATESTVAFAWGYAVSRWILIVMYWRAYRDVLETRDLVRWLSPRIWPCWVGLDCIGVRRRGSPGRSLDDRPVHRPGNAVGHASSTGAGSPRRIAPA